MNEWKALKLSDVAEVKYGKAHLSLADGEIPAYGSGGLMRYVEKALYYDESILIPRKGTLNNIIFKSEPFWTVDTMFYTELNKQYVFPKFLFYQLTTIDFANMNVGSAVPSMTVPVLRDINILLPTLPEQFAIAEVLSSIDDKIDLLHRQNKTLEQLAETLFRQWFVEEAEEGCEVGRLGDVLELVYGKTMKEEMRTGKGFPVVGSSGVVGYHDEYCVEGPGIVIGRKGTLGKVIYLFENFFPIDTTYFIKSKNKSAGLYFEFFLLKTLNFEEMNSDSAVPGLNRDIALSSEVKIPPGNRISEFNNHCSTFFQKIKSNTTQINTLTQLRDTLLPKLMSGEVQVNCQTYDEKSN